MQQVYCKIGKCVLSKFYSRVVVVRTWSRQPSTGGLGSTLHKRIRFRTPLKLERTPKRLCAIVASVDIGGDPPRLPPLASPDAAVTGLCILRSASRSGGRGMADVTLKDSVQVQHLIILRCAPHCIYVFCVYPRTNSDYFPILVGFYNADG
jgi:hypothetical protein